MGWSHLRFWSIGALIRILMFYPILALICGLAPATMIGIAIFALVLESALLLVAVAGRARNSVTARAVLAIAGLNGFYLALAGAAMMTEAGAHAVHLAGPAAATALSLVLTFVALGQIDMPRIHRRMVRSGGIVRSDGVSTLDPSKLRLDLWVAKGQRPWQRLLGYWLPLVGLPLALLASGARYGADVSSPMLLMAGHGLALLSVVLYPIMVGSLVNWRLTRLEETVPSC
ncbi:hypothetical protein [Roseicyclus mahoneyensis]|uniref:Uncharacterized protein n=1 Tax=Roseicyclus mahoneyensis TaxID=164332 RepID=A0A316GL28_9RHOB|nr:hypothetical protein [Roseicyclus mahoneyensis]PWK61522.1 hypothetical protein C7455_102211 [Roseicyclus mahoneyensis]